jgi:hypothetical protein
MDSVENSGDAMSEFRFNVFGKFILVDTASGGWNSFYLGPDGKRRPADFVIPEFISAEDLEQYLGDLFHECATPLNNDVKRIE